MSSLELGRRRLAPAAASGALAAICGIGLLATSGWLIARASERPPIFVLSVAIGSVQAFALGRGVARYLERLGVHDLSLSRLGALRVRLYDLLEPFVPGGLEGRGSGAVVSGFVSDTELVAEGLAKRLGAAIDVTASVVIGAALACLVQPVLGALLAAGAGAVVLGALGSARLARPGAEAEARLRAELAEAVVDALRSAPELVAYEREDLLRERLSEVRRRSMTAARRRSTGLGLGRAAGTLLSGAAMVAVVGAGLAVHDEGHLSGVMLAVVAFVALSVFDQVAGLASVLGDVDASRAAARRLDVLSAARRPAPEPAVDRSPATGPIAAALCEVDLTLGGNHVLQGVSLEAGSGRRVALTGASGSGKTTALHALLHFVSVASGRATLGEVDVSEMTREGIARHVGWMADETHVFATSLADNLRLARPAASDAELVEVLDRAGLSSWYASLPDGLATDLGSGARAVSAGERQRLGMARALLAEGSVLLLDEPTAHLDPVTAPEVLSELLEATGDRAVLIVSHEPDIGRLVDAVVTLGDPSGDTAGWGASGASEIMGPSGPSPLGSAAKSRQRGVEASPGSSEVRAVGRVDQSGVQPCPRS